MTSAHDSRLLSFERRLRRKFKERDPEDRALNRRFSGRALRRGSLTRISSPYVHAVERASPKAAAGENLT